MVKQTYQEVSKIMHKDIERLKKKGLESLDDIDIQDYFLKRKKRHPEKYERLTFDNNNHKPYSEDVSSIISNLLSAGILKTIYYHIE